MDLPSILDALSHAGGWTVAALEAIGLLAATVKVLAIDQRLVPTRLLSDEQARSQRLEHQLEELLAASEKVARAVEILSERLQILEALLRTR